MDQSPPEIAWTETGVPIATRFDDPYFSITDGLAETRHVFLGGNRLAERFAAPLHVAELGFGTGLNLLATWAAWEEAGARAPLAFTSFEAFPLSPEDAARALSRFEGLGDRPARLAEALARGPGPHDLAPGLTFTRIDGDARQTLPLWDGRADAWFLDGFAPARNPQMWEPGLMAEVARHTRPGGTFATYTAAGHVRRALAAAGFEVSRQKGFGTKRHMTVGQLPE